MRRALTALAILLLVPLHACDPTTPPQLPGIGPTDTSALEPSGTITTTHAGQVIENVAVTGEIRVNHSNVTIRNFAVRGGAPAIDIIPGASGTKVSNCLLDGGSDPGPQPAISYARYEMRHCELVNFGEGPMANGDVIIHHNWMHDFIDYGSVGAHQDGVQVVCNNNIQITDNIIDMDIDANAAIMIGTACGPVDNVLIEGNVLAGGGFTVYGGSAPGWTPNATNVRIADNWFSTKHYPRGGYHGPLANTYDAQVTGNRWLDGPNAGQPIA